MAQKQRRAKNVLPSQRTRKPPGGFSSRGAALLADLKLMHPHDQGVFRTLGVDDQMQLRGFHRPRSRAHLLLPVRFGCPQEIKKAAGSAARNKGTNASKTLGLPAEPPSSGSQRCRGCRLRTAKKRSSPTRSPHDASIPPLRGMNRCARRNKCAAIQKRPLRRGASGTPLKVVETWLLLQRSLTSFPF